MAHIFFVIVKTGTPENSQKNVGRISGVTVLLSQYFYKL